MYNSLVIHSTSSGISSVEKVKMKYIQIVYTKVYTNEVKIKLKPKQIT